MTRLLTFAPEFTGITAPANYRLWWRKVTSQPLASRKGEVSDKSRDGYMSQKLYLRQHGEIAGQSREIVENLSLYQV